MDLIEAGLGAEYVQGAVTPIEQPFTTDWRTMPYMVTVQLLNGELLLELDGEPSRTLGLGEALAVRAGLRHRLTLMTPGQAVSRWSHVRFTAFVSLDIMTLLHVPVIVRGETAVRIGTLNHSLAQCQQHHSLGGAVQRRSLLYQLFDALCAACPETARDLDALRGLQRLAPTLSRIAERLDDPTVSVRELAKRAGLSPSRFHELFKSVLGRSPSQYIQNQRMARAEQLLIGSDLRVRDIAVRAGWADEFHFSRLFKQLHGVSPLGYRTQVGASGL